MSASRFQPARLLAEFDAVALAGGSEQPRDLTAPGRDLTGIHFAMDFLAQQNRRVAGQKIVDAEDILATDKDVIVIGGGDTGSDCVGTSIRQGARSVTQLEIMPKPPVHENKLLTWPDWPLKLRTSSSHEEGCERDWAVATKQFIGQDGQVTALQLVRLAWRDDKGRPSDGGSAWQ
jgi:glutamate synthase (NADPH/NADH) small chain